jgi:SAM-dependent methyltransferase
MDGDRGTWEHRPVPADPQDDPVVERARAYFEEFAAGYDGAALESGWMPNELVTEALAAVGPVGNALDLACGTGGTLAVLRHAFPDADLVGVDLSASMLELAATLVPEAHLVHDDLARFTASTDGRFDLVTAIGGFEFTAGLPELLRAVRALVRPEGHLIFTYEPEVVGWEPQSARAETNLGSNGLELTTLRFEPGEVAAGFEGWDLLRSRLVVAYLRDGLPTVYSWLHYRRTA